MPLRLEKCDDSPKCLCYFGTRFSSRFDVFVDVLSLAYFAIAYTFIAHFQPMVNVIQPVFSLRRWQQLSMFLFNGELFDFYTFKSRIFCLAFQQNICIFLSWPKKCYEAKWNECYNKTIVLCDCVMLFEFQFDIVLHIHSIVVYVLHIRIIIAGWKVPLILPQLLPMAVVLLL